MLNQKIRIGKKLIEFILFAVGLSLITSFVSLINIFSFIKEGFITIDYSDGFILEAVWRLKNGLSVYQNFSIDFNGLTAVYPPVFYYYSLSISKITGLSVNLDLLLIANFFALALLSAVIYKITELETKNKIIGVISALVFFLIFKKILIYAAVKVDILAALLSFLGVYLFLSFKSFKNNKLVYLSLVPFLLALFTKQTSITVFLAILILLFCSDKKRWLIFTAIYSLATITIFAIINRETGGYFYHSVIETHLLTEYSLSLLVYLLLLSILVIIALLFCVKMYANDKRKKFWISFVLIIFLFDVLLLAKNGSGLYYLTDLSVIISITLGIFLNDAIIFIKNMGDSHIFNSPGLDKNIFLNLFLFFAISSFLILQSISGIFLPSPEVEYYARGQNELNSFFLTNKNKNILSEENIFNFINDKHNNMYEFFVFNQLVKRGRWKQEILFDKLKDDYEYVVLSTNINNDFNLHGKDLSKYYNDRFSKELLAFIKTNFELYKEIKGYNGVTLYYIFKKKEGLVHLSLLKFDKL